MGLKAAAMIYFQKKKLFPKNLIVLDAEKSNDDIEKSVCCLKSEKCQFTIRFSCEKELGLPRCFTSSQKEALAFIKKNRRKNWSTIIYDSIDVKNSYELYLDNEKSILECVPGMWESDSKLNADFVLIKDGKMSFQRVAEVRKARFENSMGEFIENVSPISREEFMYKTKLILEQIKDIKKDLEANYPINIHFVEDEKGMYYFLNMRLVKKINFIREMKNELFVIHNKQDLSLWNKKDTLLLSIDIERGEEGLLLEIVSELKKTEMPVYVEFGMLSHPAILLRECGITVLPLFYVHDHYEINY